MADPIAEATALLSTLMHCRRQARELQACQRGGSGGAGGGDCARQEQAFVTCSHEHLPSVIGHLIKVRARLHGAVCAYLALRQVAQLCPAPCADRRLEVQ